MSSDSFDPVEVAALQPEDIDAARDRGPGRRRRRRDPRRAQVRRARPRRRPVAAGPGQPRDRRPAAGRPIGGRQASRPGPRVGEAGRRGPPGRARGRARRADARRGVRRRHAADRPPPRPGPGTRSPPSRSGSATSSSPWAGRSPRAPRPRSAWFNFDALNTPAEHPSRELHRHLLRRVGRLRRRAAHADLAGADPHDARAHRRRSTSSARARCSAPTSSTPRTPRSSTRSRGWPSTRA